MQKYDIIRFYKNGNKKRLIHYKVTENQAKEWCGSQLTRKENKYFDGFTATGTHYINNKPRYDHYFTPTPEYC